MSKNITILQVDLIGESTHVHKKNIEEKGHSALLIYKTILNLSTDQADVYQLFYNGDYKNKNRNNIWRETKSLTTNL